MREKSRSVGASCDELEELEAGCAPGLILSQEVLVPVVVAGESRRGGRNTVVRPDDGGQSLGGFEIPTVLIHEPLLQDHVSSQGVRNLAPLERIHRFVDQPCLLHTVVKGRDLHREGRGALADVVDAGDPGCEQAELLHRGQS